MKNVFLILENYKYQIYDGNWYFDEYHNILIVTNTDLYDLNNNQYSLKNIIDIYIKNSKSIGNYILGLFTLLIVDFNKNQCLCIQDSIGDSTPIYFYRFEKKLIISNSLKKILIHCKNMQFEISNVKEFLLKGFIKKSNTLLKDVYKLDPKKDLLFKLDDCYSLKYRKKKTINKDSAAQKDYYSLLTDEIKKESEKYQNLMIPLSNGYDSNLILSILKDKRIRAFSIGGTKGTNEISKVIENTKNYDDIVLKTKIVDHNTLKDYPSIVFKLEGLLYEKGIFLQFALSELLKENYQKNSVLFLGDGADQVLSLGYYNNIRYCVSYLQKIMIYANSFIKNHSIIGMKKDYDFLSYIISKKSGIFMNDFNITLNYPYLNSNILKCAYKLRFKNGYHKRVQKETCNKYLNSNIVKNLRKSGGSTDSTALFRDKKEFQKIEKIAMNSRYNLLKISNNIKQKDYFDYILKIIYLEIFDYIFINKNNYNLLDKNSLSIELNELIDYRK